MPDSIPDAGRNASLTRKYALTFAGLVSVLLALSSVIGGVFSYRESVAALAALHEEKARAVAAEIGHFVAGIRQPLAWAVITPMRRAPEDGSDLHLELLTLLRRVSSISELTWIDKDGRERHFVSRFELDRRDSGRDHAVDPRFLNARRVGVDVGAIYFRKESEPYLPLSISDPGQPGPVLLAEINLKFVRETIDRSRFGEAGRAYVIDASGQLVAHPDIMRVLRRTDVSGLVAVRAALAGDARAGESLDVDGRPVLTASAAVPGLPWHVVVEQPRAEAMAPVYRLLMRSAALMLAGIVAATLVAFLLARRLVRPIRQLEAGAAVIGAGDLSARIDLKSGDELERLGARFNDMAARLADHYATLESRIAERTRELAAANEAKSRFLAAASHDLRQPMHALALFVGHLRHLASDPAQQGLAEQMERSTTALEQLLDALLDISRLDAGGVVPRPQPFALQGLFERIAVEFAPLAQAKGLSLRLRPTSHWVRSDPVLLERILINLVANALRYTRAGGVLLAARRHGTAIRIVVADSGIGIAAEDLAKVFDEFYQAANAERDRSQGLGLGLAIVDRLAKLLGHAVTVRSRPGRGSVFGLDLPPATPVATTTAPSNTATQPGRAELEGRRILVIDDEGEVRAAIDALLRDWGCRPLLAADADAASAMIDAGRPPDVVLSDLRLRGEADGIVALRRLAPPGGTTRGVLITGDTAPERVRAAQASGYPVLFKPVRPARLRALLEYLLGEARG